MVHALILTTICWWQIKEDTGNESTNNAQMERLNLKKLSEVGLRAYQVESSIG
jgi:hypothetical protein